MKSHFYADSIFRDSPEGPYGLLGKKYDSPSLLPAIIAILMLFLSALFVLFI